MTDSQKRALVLGPQGGGGNFLHALLDAGIGLVTGGPAAAIVGGINGLNSGSGGAGTAKQATQTAQQNSTQAQAAQQQMQQIAQALYQRYQTASPEEQAALSYYFNRAGLGANGNAPGGNGVGLNGAPSYGPAGGGAAPGMLVGANGQQFAARSHPGVTQAAIPQTPANAFAYSNPSPGLVNGNQGIFGSPAYQLALQQAQDSINHQAQLAGKNFGNSMVGRGLQNSSAMAGGQAAIAQGANKAYSDFARQLAIQAPATQDQLVQQSLAAAQGALGAGNQAANIYSGAAGLGYQGQQINQNQGNLLNSAQGTAYGNLLQNQQLSSTLNNMLGGGGGGGSNNNIGGTGGTLPAAPASVPGQYTTLPDGTVVPAFAQGGPVQGGRPILVGDGGGSETYIPNGMDPDTDFAHFLSTRYNPQPQIVGGQGPSYFVPPANGFILPHAQTQQMLANSGGTHPLVTAAALRGYGRTVPGGA